ncbi:MAG: HAD-IA family hydrolase [Gordonia sp. (in: high G+C Gram-positive bacteria)]
MLGLPENITVALFDLDGVLTDTASVHMRAWTLAFNAYLTERGAGEHKPNEDLSPFTDQDYLDFVDGRPRTDGVANFFASRRIDASASEINAVADSKNDEFLGTLASDGVTAYPGSVQYLNAAREAGLRTAVVTSSKNGAAVLEVAGLTQYVEQRVDGNTIVEEHLRGKPAPDSYLRGAELMGVAPRDAAVFEDAISGVQAGRSGDFGYVVGVDRVGGDQAENMRSAGASVVVTDLADLLATA